LKDLLARIRWLASGAEEDPQQAFDWISSPSATRPNPEGLRSVWGTAALFAALGALADALILARHAWSHAWLFALLHLIWMGAFVAGALVSVGHLETIDGRLLSRLGGPNTITLGRAVFVPPLIYLIATQDFRMAVIAYALLVASDVVDGLWARMAGLRSKFGIVLDPVADLFFHAAVFVSLGLVGLLPRAALWLIAARSALLVVGTGLLHFHKGSVRIQPTPLGKGTGVLLGLATILILGLAGFAPGRYPGTVAFLRGLLTFLLALLVLHGVAIGIINLGWRKPWLEPRRPRGGTKGEGGDAPQGPQ
jgi:cardiolipin synthase